MASWKWLRVDGALVSVSTSCCSLSSSVWQSSLFTCTKHWSIFDVRRLPIWTAKEKGRIQKEAKAKKPFNLITWPQHVLDTLVCLVATNIWFKIHIRSLLKIHIRFLLFHRKGNITSQNTNLMVNSVRCFIFSGPFLVFSSSFLLSCPEYLLFCRLFPTFSQHPFLLPSRLFLSLSHSVWMLLITKYS